MTLAPLRRALLGAALLLPAVGQAQIAFGEPAPLADQPFEAADGSSISLAEAGGDAGLVVLFWSNTCPWTSRYADRVADLVGEYTAAGVGFVLVNANDAAQNEREGAAASREYAASLGLAAPYLVDTSGTLAGAFGAVNTPHAFYFGPAGTLLYDGAVDDSPADAGRVQVPYLRQAMDQSVAGLPIEVQRTQAFGCTIKRAGS